MTRNTYLAIAAAMIGLATISCTKQTSKNTPSQTQQTASQMRHRVMFYNAENLFDPFNDSLKRDDEFTPDGSRHWTWTKMTKKVNGIYKTIMALGEIDPPVLVGMCEIENRIVLKQLTNNTPLERYEYHIIHRDSPDSRGIDVALLYRPDRFKLIEKRFFSVKFPDNPNRKTREILYACGMLGSDTLHVFVNHWPSKFGGKLESIPGRMAAAHTLRHKVDSIRIFYPQARILIMGDMNDEPEGTPTTEGLGACLNTTDHCPANLINVSAILKARGQYSYKYQGVWGIIDHIIVSRSLLRPQGLSTSIDRAGVFAPEFLLEEDRTYTGQKPYRTYVGYKYIGGFSDHLPVYIDLMEH